MNTDKLLLHVFFAVFGLLSLVLIILYVASSPLRSKAASNTITIKIQAQGGHRELDQLKTHIDFYNGPNKVFEEPNVLFTYKGGSFVADITLKSDFNFSDRYALFIKPYRLNGRIFCSEQVNGSICTVPQFAFLTSGNTVDLTPFLFYAGDIPPANGKVDALDMSLIMKNLGKLATESDTTDVNGDGITDVVDYSLALYSLSQSITDDTVRLVSPPSLSPTKPAVSPTISLSPAPTAPTNPTATPSPTLVTTPTASPSPTLVVTPSVTLTPGPTASPSPTLVVEKTCRVSVVDAEDSLYDIKAGQTSSCQCPDLFGSRECFTSTCVSCPSGICECTITTLPPQTIACTNNGELRTLTCIGSQ